jgi:Ribbon-helix-helix protein, copG family
VPKLKTSLYLDVELDRALTQAAGRERLSKAEFIRRALAGAVNELQTRRPAARGVFDGPPDAADDVDRYLDESGFGT